MLGRTVGELLDTVSYPELLEWGQFMELDPEPEWRADARSAQICAILANVNRDSKQRPEPYRLTEFMMFDKLVEAARTPEAEREADTEDTPATPVKPKPKNDGARLGPGTFEYLLAMSRKGKH